MCKQERIIILIFSLIFLINIIDGSPLFQRFLFGPSSPTTDDPLGHISDFRGRPRTDSRADKPDLFPGFDNADAEAEIKTTTARSRTEIYTEIIGNIIGNVRERITSVITNNLTPIRRPDNHKNENIVKTRRQLNGNKRKITTVKPQESKMTDATTLMTTGTVLSAITTSTPIMTTTVTSLKEAEINLNDDEKIINTDETMESGNPKVTSSVLIKKATSTSTTTTTTTTTTPSTVSPTTTKSSLNTRNFENSDYSDESKEDGNSEIDIPSVIASAATDGRRRRKDTQLNLLNVNPIDSSTTEFIGLNLNDNNNKNNINNNNDDDVSIGYGDSSSTVINGNINFLPSLLSAIFNRPIIDEKYNYLQKTPINNDNNNKHNDNNDDEDEEDEQVTIKEDNLIQMMTSMLNPFVEWWSAAMEKINLDKNPNNNENHLPLKIKFNEKFQETINDKMDKNFLLKFFNLNETNINKGKLAFDNAFNKYSTIFHNNNNNNDDNESLLNIDDNLINIHIINELNNMMHPLIKDNQQLEMINDNKTSFDVNIDDNLNKTIITIITGTPIITSLKNYNETLINHNDKIKIFDPEAIGIFILELFGSVAGLTWGAINQVFHRNTDN